MSYKLIGGGSSLETVVSDVNQNILELKGREVTDMFKDETGTRRVLVGKGDNGFYGFKVSKEGFDVFTATDNDLIFTSDSQSVFNVVDIDTISSPAISIAAPGVGNYAQSLQTTSVAHGLGYIPAFMAFLANGGEYVSLPYTFYSGAGTGGQWYSFSFTVDATNVNFSIDVLVTGGSAISYPAGTNTVKYFLLQESAN